MLIIRLITEYDHARQEQKVFRLQERSENNPENEELLLYILSVAEVSLNKKSS